MAASFCRRPSSTSTPLFVVAFLLSTVYLTVTAEITVKKCFKGTDKEPEGEMTLTCPTGSIISISKALVGKNRWFECVLTGDEDDCMHLTGIFRECEGLTTCNRTFRTYSARCGYITILMVSYTCIKVTIPITVDPSDMTTSPVSPHKSGGPEGEGEDATKDRTLTDTDRENINTYKQGGTDREKEDEELEVGLLVGTILASLVTGVMLVIAIVMTIRRLLNYPMRLQRREGENPSRVALCMERACFHVDKLPCFSGPDSLEGSGEQSLRSQKSTTVPLSCDEITAQNSQRTRMTPIGQEASDAIVQSKVSNDRDDNPEGSDASRLAQTTPADIEANASRSSFKLKEVVVVAGVNCSLKNSPDKTQNWNEKEIKMSKTGNFCYNNNNNNNIPESIDLNHSATEDALSKSKEIADFKLYAEPKGVDGELPFQCNKTPENTSLHKHQHPTDYGSAGLEHECSMKKPKYTAIVVPNTETSSRC